MRIAKNCRMAIPSGIPHFWHDFTFNPFKLNTIWEHILSKEPVTIIVNIYGDITVNIYDNPKVA